MIELSIAVAVSRGTMMRMMIAMVAGPVMGMGLLLMKSDKIG